MHHKSPKFKAAIVRYLELKEEYSNLLDHCHTGKNFDTVCSELWNQSEIIKASVPRGKTFVHGYLILNNGVDLCVYAKKKERKKLCRKK